MSKLYLAIGCLWLCVYGQEAIACSCVGPTLQKLIARSDEIVLGKVASMQKDERIKDGLKGDGVLSVLSVLKGATDELALGINIYRNNWCDCSFSTKHRELEKLPGTYVIGFFSRHANKLVLDDFIECDTREGCDVLVQRLNEMIGVQKAPNWQSSDAEMKWLLRCMASDATIGYVYHQLFEWKDEGAILKDFKQLLNDDLKKSLEAKLYASSKIGCREAYLILLVANWEDEKVVPLAFQFLKNEKETTEYYCDDADIYFVSPVVHLLPNMVRMIAAKTDLPEAAKFAGLFRERDEKEILSEFLRFVEGETKKRQQQKMRYAIALVVCLVGGVFVVHLFRTHRIAIIKK